MEIKIIWKDGDQDNIYCDTVSFLPDYHVLVVWIGDDQRSFVLNDIKKIVVKGVN